MAITELEITKRTSFASAKSFGDVGPYELLEGTAHYAVDPLNPRNQGITDLELAPRNTAGEVEFSADFAMLRPVDIDRGNRRILFDVVNRGRKTALSLNSVPTATDPTTPLEAGNGYLMRRGYTVVWGGWQADVPPTPGLIGLQAPEAIGPQGPLTGKMLCQFQCNEPTQVFLLADRQHLPNPAADPEEAEATLTVRDLPNSPATPVDRSRWSFVRVEDEDLEPQHSHIYMPSGFEPGKIYQLVYTTTGSRIVGLGFAAMRDLVSYLKHAPAQFDGRRGNPCAGAIDYAYAMGRSQSGRFLRQYIHVGINEDEEERPALDGIIPHVAGGMRGEFNLRFGQPSKDVCYIIPELFPFTDTMQTDPVSGAQGSLLDALERRGNVPRIMFTNTSAEYWRGDAALIHTDLESLTDAPESPWARRYHFAGCQHGSGDFPPLEIRAADGIKGQLPFNSVDYAPLLRAALDNLDRWVTEGEEPPASRHPSLDDGTAVESHTLLERFAQLPDVRIPAETTRAVRLDYGPESHLGRTTKLPANDQAAGGGGRGVSGAGGRPGRIVQRAGRHTAAGPDGSGGDVHRLEPARREHRQPQPVHRHHRRAGRLDAAPAGDTGRTGGDRRPTSVHRRTLRQPGGLPGAGYPRRDGPGGRAVSAGGRRGGGGGPGGAEVRLLGRSGARGRDGLTAEPGSTGERRAVTRPGGGRRWGRRRCPGPRRWCRRAGSPP